MNKIVDNCVNKSIPSGNFYNKKICFYDVFTPILMPLELWLQRRKRNFLNDVNVITATTWA